MTTSNVLVRISVFIELPVRPLVAESLAAMIVTFIGIIRVLQASGTVFLDRVEELFIR